VSDDAGNGGRWLKECTPDTQSVYQSWPHGLTDNDVSGGIALAARTVARSPSTRCVAHELSKGAPLKLVVYGTSISANNKRRQHGPSYRHVHHRGLERPRAAARGGPQVRLTRLD